MSTTPTLYTTNEAAELLDVTPARVRQMVARDEIASVKMGRDRFITAEAIEEAKGRKTKPGPTRQPPKPKAEASGVKKRPGRPMGSTKKRGAKSAS
jgi:excisionase family DNA binding protein